MFTGIIRTLGTVESITGDADRTLTIQADQPIALARGDSVAVNGVCLTQTGNNDSDKIIVDVSAETLRHTTLGRLEDGQKVNLEPAARLGDPLGGHLLTGHVDGVGIVAAIESEARSTRIRIEVPENLIRYFAVRGSIAIDGVSLTLVASLQGCIDVNIIPETWQQTIISDYSAGRHVNLEVDLIARYLEQLNVNTYGYVPEGAAGPRTCDV